MIGKKILHKGRIQAKLGLVAAKCDSFLAACKYRQLMGLGVQLQQENFAIYTLIYVWKQYFQLSN